MKAKILLFGLCALSLAACSVDETKQVNDANSVSFKATVPYATRAAATTANSLGSFSVWAWTDGSTFMNHVTATNNGSGTYTTSPLYFWPTTSVDFLGLSPAADGYDGNVAYLGGTVTADVEDTEKDPYYSGYVAAVTPGVTADGKTGLGGTIMVDVPSSYEDQIDLCYAVATNQTSGSVAMNFRHALSQVVFAARNTNEEMTVKIAGVSVCSVYKTGQYALPQVSTATNLGTDDLGTSSISESQGMWTLGTSYGKSHFSAGLGLATDTDGNPTEAITLSGAGSAADVLTASDGALFLIPQEVEEWDVLTDSHLEGFGSYFRILCNITEDGAQIWPNSVEESYYEENSSEATNIIMIGEEEYAEIAIPVDVVWEEGCKYTYTFVFGEGAGYYPPDDPNYDLDGTPVLVPISFTVSADEFQKTEDVEVSTQTESITVHSAADLQAAINAGDYDEIVVSGTITMSDFESDVYWLTIDKDCTINFSEGSELVTANLSSSTPGLYITGGTTTLTGEGTITYDTEEYPNPDNTQNYYAIWLVGGNVVIDGDLTIVGESHTVYAQKGFAYIYNGSFKTSPTNDQDDYWVLNCNDSNYKSGNANIYCYGGKYYNFDPGDNNTEGEHTNYVVDGYVSTQSDEIDEGGFYWYTVTKAD